MPLQIDIRKRRCRKYQQKCSKILIEIQSIFVRTTKVLGMNQQYFLLPRRTCFSMVHLALLLAWLPIFLRITWPKRLTPLFFSLTIAMLRLKTYSGLSKDLISRPVALFLMKKISTTPMLLVADQWWLEERLTLWRIKLVSSRLLLQLFLTG